MKIIKPLVEEHDGSSFRELVDLWGERNFCEVVEIVTEHNPYNPDAKCWFGEKGNVLLYDFDILDHLKVDYELCLFSNMVSNGEKDSPWVYWPKHSRIYDNLKESLRKPLSERKTKCGFIGSATTAHRRNVSMFWSTVCDKFELFEEPTIEHEDYLNILSDFKFGLCLPGVGPKCLRDVELIGMGTVPIITPGVCTTYYDPLIENVHYFRANNPIEAQKIIDECDDKTWKEMSTNCINWFEKNCSVEGTFSRTVEIIEKKLMQ